MDKKNLQPLSDRDLEQATGGVTTTTPGSMQNSSCRSLRSEAACKKKSNCEWEDGLCVPADDSQTSPRSNGLRFI